jgi:hypothetical protein
MVRWIAVVALVGAWAAFVVVLRPLVSGDPDGGALRPAPALADGGQGLTGARPVPRRPSATPVRPKRDGTLTIAWAGDMTLGSRYGLPPEGGRALFRELRGRLRAPDLTLGNLEGTLSVGGVSKCGADTATCFSFQAPPANAAALRWAGFDLVSLANNHAFDFGPTGMGQTAAALRAQRISPTGRPGEIAVLRRGGVRVAAVGFAPYPWASDLRDLAWVRALVAEAATRAEIVVVLAHAGGEGADQAHVPAGREVALGEDRGDTRAFAHAAVEAGADLVLASGPHVLRGMERHRGRLIAYSLGNFAGWRNFSPRGTLALSALLTVRVSTAGGLRGGRVTSLRLDGPGAPHLDPTGRAVALMDDLGRADFPGTGVRLRAGGTFGARR